MQKADAENQPIRKLASKVFGEHEERRQDVLYKMKTKDPEVKF